MATTARRDKFGNHVEASVNPEPISEATSKRICDHMNVDHGASIYGMVMDTLSEKEKSGRTFKNCRMTELSLENYTLEYTICQNEICEMQRKIVAFDPPLLSAKESRYVLIHYSTVCPPQPNY